MGLSYSFNGTNLTTVLSYLLILPLSVEGGHTTVFTNIYVIEKVMSFQLFKIDLSLAVREDTFQ